MTHIPGQGEADHHVRASPRMPLRTDLAMKRADRRPEMDHPGRNIYARDAFEVKNLMSSP